MLQAAAHRPSFLTVSSFFVFTPLFTAGDIGTLVLPEDMQHLDLRNCTDRESEASAEWRGQLGITGKATG